MSDDPDDLEEYDDAPIVADEIGDDVAAPVAIAFTGRRTCPHSTRADASPARCSSCCGAVPRRVVAPVAIATTRTLVTFGGRDPDDDRERPRPAKSTTWGCTPGAHPPGHDREVAAFIARAIRAGDLSS